jgi:hypothetical protein
MGSTIQKMAYFLRSTCPPDPAVTVFSELRQALEVQQVAIADRLEAVRQAEAALARLHRLFRPRDAFDAAAATNPLPPDPRQDACHPSTGQESTSEETDLGPSRECATCGGMFAPRASGQQQRYRSTACRRRRYEHRRQERRSNRPAAVEAPPEAPFDGPRCTP